MGALVPMIKTAEEQPLDLYVEWGTYDLRGPSEAWRMADQNVALGHGGISGRCL